MSKRILQLTCIVVLLASLLLNVGCVTIRTAAVGDLKTESQSIERGEAESVRAMIRMGVGDLRLSGGASKLLDATFTYNVLEWKPEMTYNVSGSKGDLVVQQPASSKLPVTGNVRYQWDLRLNNDVPTDLSLELGVGKSDLQLSGLTLNRVDVRMGVGDTMIDLTGNWKRDFDVDIQGGIGQATVRLPRGVGVRVDSKTGIGSIQYSGLRHEGGMLVNDAYGKSPVTIRMNVEAGIGAIRLDVVQ